MPKQKGKKKTPLDAAREQFGDYDSQFDPTGQHGRQPETETEIRENIELVEQFRPLTRAEEKIRATEDRKREIAEAKRHAQRKAALAAARPKQESNTS